MLGIDSIPEVKLKQGVNTDLNQPLFLELGKLMLNESTVLKRELKAVKKLEDYV